MGKELLKLDAERKSFSLAADDEPGAVEIDPDYDIARRLARSEIPPLLDAFVGEKKPLIVLPVSDPGAYAPVIAVLKDRGGVEQDAAGLRDETIKSSSLAVLGPDNPLLARLFGEAGATEARGLSAVARKNPWNPRKIILVVTAASAGEASSFPKILEHEGSSRLAFEQGRILTLDRKGEIKVVI